LCYDITIQRMRGRHGEKFQGEFSLLYVIM
jgi:hypothetical protein